MVENLTANNFKEKTNEGLSLTAFWAPWCGPCRMQAPVMDDLSEEMGDVNFFRINVDEEQQLAVKFGVMSIPALFIMKDGKVVQSLIGYNDKTALTTALNNHA